MKQFLRENWIYIVVPLAVVLILMVALLVLGGDSSSPFIYNL